MEMRIGELWEWLVIGGLPPRIQYVAIGASLFLFFLIIHLIRSGRLKEGYSLIWFLIALGTVFLAVFTGLLQVLADVLGIAYAPAALFIVLIGGLFLLAIHFSLLLHRYDQRIRNLAQEHAILQERLTRSKET